MPKHKTSLEHNNPNLINNDYDTLLLNFSRELCSILNLCHNAVYTMKYMRETLMSRALTNKMEIIMLVDGNQECQALTFPDNISEYINRIITEKFKMNPKMIFISGVITDVLQYEVIEDKWKNFKLAERIPIKIITKLNVVV